MLKLTKNDVNLLSTDSLHTDLKKRSIRSSMFVFTGSVINLVLSFGSTAILARLLLPEHFGLIGMVTAVTVIFESFKELGLSTATVQRKDLKSEQVTSLFWINAAIGICIMVFLSSVSGIMAWFYEDPRLIWITIAISTSFFWGGLMIQHRAILTRRMQFGRIIVVEITGSFLSIIVAIILAVKGFGYWALVWKEITRNFFSAIGIWIACPWIPGLPARHSNIGGMIRFGRDISAFNLIYFFSANLDKILIGKYWGANILGLYRQAYQLIMMPLNYMTSPVQRVTEPALSLLQNDDGKYRNYYRKILKLLSFVSLPLMSYLFLYAKEVVLFLLGDQWIAAADIFRVLVLANFLRPLMSTTGFVMITRGESKKYFLVGLASSVLMIIAVSVGVKWGALGVAWAFLISRLVFYIPMLYFSLKNTPITMRLFFESISDSLIPTLIMVLTIYMLSGIITNDNNFYQIAISFPVAVITYLLAWITFPGGWKKLNEYISDFLIIFKKTA